MRRLARAVFALLRVEIATMLQYRGEIVLWSTWGLVNPLVLYAIFKAGAMGNDDQRMAGLTVPQIAAYYFAMMIVGHVTAAWDTHEMSWYIRTGRMSAMLLRPILPMWKSMAGNIAYKVCTLAFVGPMWILVAFLIRPEFNATPRQFMLGLLAVVLAGLMNYFLTYVVALVAFWTTKLDAVGEVYFGLAMFVGGRLAPLDALPGPIRAVADVLPFKYMAAFPVEMLMGRITVEAEIMRGLMVQTAWLVASLILFRSLWAVALKRYTAVSG